jgi:hypothetical protein
MPTGVDYPSGLGTADAWGLEGAASKLAAMAADDADTSIVYADSGGAIRVQRFTFPLLAGVTDPVTSCTLTAKVREYAPGAGGRLFYFQYNSAQAGTDQSTTIRLARPAYATLTYAASGGGLALAQVNGEHGLQMTAAGGPTQKWEVWCTTLYRTVVFVYAGGSADAFAHIIGSLIGAIGAGLLLRDMPALARAAFRRTGLLISPDEYERALRAWRRERHLRMA